MKKAIPTQSLCAIMLLLGGCSMPSRDSEEYQFNKMMMEQRMQCQALPHPLSESCLDDLKKKNYADYLRQKNKN